ncbi:MAG: fasciclin domain-containing protein [Phycisphaerales bacterium JB043]
MNRQLLTCLAIASTTLHATSAQSADPEPNIVEVAQDAGQFGTLLAAAQAAGLVEALTADGPLTVFAPTDDAFAALPEGTVEDLLKPENKERLTAILLYHVVDGEIFASEAIKVENAKTVQGDRVNFKIEGGGFFVEDSRVLANDIVASNGVVHVINKVLIPQNLPANQPAGDLIIGVYTGNVSRALAAQLDIDRHDAFLITGVTSGSNADRAGIERYDVVVAIDGEDYEQGDLARAKRRSGAGGTLELTVIRKGHPLDIEVTVDLDRH